MLKKLAGYLLQHPFIRFGLVGSAGYFVDAGVLAFDTSVLGLDFVRGRALSIFIALCFTWLGNRNLTFADRKAHGAGKIAEEWLKFLGANAVGAAINYVSSVLLEHYASGPFHNKFVAQACGVLIGMLFNFTLSSKLVFKGPI